MPRGEDRTDFAGAPGQGSRRDLIPRGEGAIAPIAGSAVHGRVAHSNLGEQGTHRDGHGRTGRSGAPEQRLRQDQRDSEHPDSSPMDDAGWPPPPCQEQRGAECTDLDLADNAGRPLPPRPASGRMGRNPAQAAPARSAPAALRAEGAARRLRAPFSSVVADRGEPSPPPCPGARGKSAAPRSASVSPCRERHRPLLGSSAE